MQINSQTPEYKQNIPLNTLTPIIGTQVIEEWNDTQVVDHDLCIHHMFEMQVERSPQAIAVVFEDIQLTYQQLNKRANQLAHNLRTLGVGPEVLVGICLERSLEMIVGILGILKAGGAYVPLDPAYPPERLAFILSDTQASVLLTQEKLVKNLPPHQAQVVCLDSNWQGNTENNQENPVNQTTADNLVYVIYTSGSTGQPKGVMIPHRGICNQLYWRQTNFRLTQADKVLLTISFSFDPSVWQIFWPLCFGGQLILARPGGQQDTAYLVKVIIDQQITVLALVPSILRVLLEEKGIENCRFLRHITCGGEALPSELIEGFFAKLNLENVFHNCYGPTEASIDTTFWTCQRGTNYTIAPIGRPITNAEIHILDENLQPVPVGESGELYIGGIGLARGYLNRPELTTEKFIFNPFSSEAGARLYKTGDLARYLSDGNVEFLGRIDHQVKIRGFRIELGEIEAVLRQHRSVKEVVVIMREKVQGDKRLVAYLTLKQEQTAKVEQLRRFLQQKLPIYMMPSAFVILKALPMTPNGKIDRHSLPEPTQTRQQAEETFVAPSDETELQLARIWEKVLGIEPISITDNFFDLGGNSLLSIRLFAQVQKAFKKDMPLAILYQNPTIEQLAIILRQLEFSPSLSCLVPIKPNGSKPPLFLCQGFSLYQSLVPYLDSERPVYALISRDGQGMPVRFNGIEELASRYINEIKTLQPEGPYFLGGHSFGGVIAFEMAQQLSAQGQQIALLALFDSYVPGTMKKMSMSKRLSYNLKQFLKMGPAYLLKLCIERLSQKYGNLALKNQFIRTKNLQYLVSQAAYFKLVEEYATKYIPQVYLGRITLLMASDRRFQDEPELGWTKLAGGGLEIHEIPGDHLSIFKEPSIRLMAKKLELSIDERLI
ncbi:Glutamate-1-semialdehyde aminotransferase [Nostoc flagelliforme CCNUN1]|uniref:Glutamate-1-semialdehyde aminotransferase n=1 Tax=Nostoc flagelliforme CCNUN1 TaxID=2038116 RepID=A0A2K8SM25_9NOSO|nr:amino acid adenylation domain-containing protein [Nostoc flagelliforme]AUB36524.1 Glutamate-1-semialdehyde aminotransferase [Nostoc flagelliforme CCNUN1]